MMVGDPLENLRARRDFRFISDKSQVISAYTAMAIRGFHMFSRLVASSAPMEPMVMPVM